MKRFFILFFFLTSFLSGYVQPSRISAIEDLDNPFATGAVPIVTGKLLHASPEELQKINIVYSLVTLSGQVKKTAGVSADGSFKLELDYPLPYQQIWFSVGDLFYAGLYANKDLHVELDLAKLKASGKQLHYNGEGVKYLGADGPLNVYMNDYILFRRKEQLALNARLYQIPRSQNPVAAELLSAHDAVYDSLKMIEDDYIAKHPSPYARLLQNERMSDYYGRICVSYWGHTMESALLDKLKAHKTYLVSNNSTTFYSYLATYFRVLPATRVVVSWKDVAAAKDLDDAEKAAIDSLRAAARLSPNPPYTSENQLKWSKQLQPRLTQLQRDRNMNKCIHLLDSIFPASASDMIRMQLADSKDVIEQKKALERIMPGMRTEWCRTVLRSEYARAIEKIEAVNKALASSKNSLTAADFGKPMLQTGFGASLYKISNMSGTDFLAKLRKSFAGKAMILDRWATWCLPCLAEMPHSRELQQDSKDLPVMFVYMCTASGSDEDKWKRKIAELKLPGIHFYIDEKLDAELSKYFSFTGYPGYALIDRNGVYKPGAFKRVSEIKDRAALGALIR